MAGNAARHSTEYSWGGGEEGAVPGCLEGRKEGPCRDSWREGKRGCVFLEAPRRRQEECKQRASAPSPHTAPGMLPARPTPPPHTLHPACCLRGHTQQSAPHQPAGHSVLSGAALQSELTRRRARRRCRRRRLLGQWAGTPWRCRRHHRGAAAAAAAVERTPAEPVAAGVAVRIRAATVAVMAAAMAAATLRRSPALARPAPEVLSGWVGTSPSTAAPPEPAQR
eukprot:365729-Chlamydomonas_euryale.AAC.5